MTSKSSGQNGRTSYRGKTWAPFTPPLLPVPAISPAGIDPPAEACSTAASLSTAWAEQALSTLSAPFACADVPEVHSSARFFYLVNKVPAGWAVMLLGCSILGLGHGPMLMGNLAEWRFGPGDLQRSLPTSIILHCSHLVPQMPWWEWIDWGTKGLAGQWGDHSPVERCGDVPTRAMAKGQDMYLMQTWHYPYFPS